MPEVSEKEFKLLQALKHTLVITENKDEFSVYRMRLFSERERTALRHAIRQGGKYRHAGVCAGMMDELEMVRFEAHGKTKIARTI